MTADLSTPEKRGRYIVTIAVCADCHTPRGEQGEHPPGLDFAGGTRLTFTGVPDAFSANITPGVNGIPYYNEELFIETMRTGRVRARQLSSLMPTDFYRHMSDEDLKAIFAYLKTLAPVDHYVDNDDADRLPALRSQARRRRAQQATELVAGGLRPNVNGQW